jgi:hypothetical protein
MCSPLLFITELPVVPRISKYSWQSVGNVLAMITGAIAAGLYGPLYLRPSF